MFYAFEPRLSSPFPPPPLLPPPPLTASLFYCLSPQWCVRNACWSSPTSSTSPELERVLHECPSLTRCCNTSSCGLSVPKLLTAGPNNVGDLLCKRTLTHTFTHTSIHTFHMQVRAHITRLFCSAYGPAGRGGLPSSVVDVGLAQIYFLSHWPSKEKYCIYIII